MYTDNYLYMTTSAITTSQRLEKALEFAQYQSTLNRQRKILKEKFEADTIIAFNGGLFKITQEWIGGFDKLATWFIDMNGYPVKINSNEVDNFLLIAKSAYSAALEEYGNSYEILRKQRSVKSLTNHD